MIKKIKIIVILILIIVCVLLLKKIINNNVTNIYEFQEMMTNYGIFGPIILTIIQCIQVVIQVLPGYLGCAVGAISYGVLMGFICNYIGICLGSIIAFLLAEKYGEKIILELFSQNVYENWTNKINKKKSYNTFLFIATLLPLFPDDFLCYFSGLIHMNKKQFIWIILLGKPWCILAYSILFGLIK